ncbi:HNH endonuclease [Agromyces mediolanus]|uniref:HNH endonuclease signature motif containing protein n=1 Tax=Agromyces mediolanus TaxID=41986 RepID=UPI002041A52B|nr:HNH endonuclease signature motif containing protein [Agromyces mediolanus]MCM3658676.1 HNH endonuclease [Agromyces mediolanus]
MHSTTALASFIEATATVAEAWSGAQTGAASGADAEVHAMSGAGLVCTIEALARAARALEALQARCAAELADRSCGEVDADLAREHGFPSAAKLLTAASGGRSIDAVRLIEVGRAISARRSFFDEELPAKRPLVAAAMHGGGLCLDAAGLITRFLERAALRCDPEALSTAEALLVERAPIVGVDGLHSLVKRLEAHLDPDGVEPREDELRARRSLTIREDRFGMILVRGAFDPESGAAVKSAVDALVGAALRVSRGRPRAGEARDRNGNGNGNGNGNLEAAGTGAGTDADADDPLFREDRSIAQLNADALADLARHALGCGEAPTALRRVTVVARVDAEALVSGEGYATIDGVDQPISIATARALALSAGISPLLLGDRRARLDLGRTARLFSTEQKLVLIDRDGGCAWPGCLRPPGYAEAHHIAWWQRDEGRTDAGNGIMLCSHHHHRVHRDGWRIRLRDDRSWFVPPPHLDPQQVPRPGNLASDRLLAERFARRRRPSRGAPRGSSRRAPANPPPPASVSA